MILFGVSPGILQVNNVFGDKSNIFLGIFCKGISVGLAGGL